MLIRNEIDVDILESVEKSPCDQLDNGCTCDECTAQITEACGIIYDCSPVPDDHEFEDDCQRIEQ